MTSTIEGNNFVGSLLESLLKKVTPLVGSRMLCEGFVPAPFEKSQLIQFLSKKENFNSISSQTLASTC
jgi:hypothetical protein